MTMDELLAALKALIEKADEENRPLTDEEATEAESLRSQIEAHKKTAEYRSLSAAYNTPKRPDLHVHAGGKDEVSTELRSMVHFMKTGEIDAEYRALTKGTNSAGGFLVPTTMQNRIIERLKAFGGLFDQATKVSTDSGEAIQWATEDDTANEGEIVAEGAAAAGGADKVFAQATLNVFKYEATGTGGLPMKVSWELLEDSPIDLEQFISNNFARRIMRKLAAHLATGTGSGQPQGIVTPQTAALSIADNATGPTYAELLATVAALDPEYRSGAKWLMNDATWVRILGMTDDNGRPLILPQAQSGIQGGVQMQLLGYPVIIDQGMPSIGDATKPIVFGDLREAYVVRQVNGFHMVRFEELYAVNGFIGFLGWQRFGGMVQNLNAYVVLGAQDTA